MSTVVFCMVTRMPVNTDDVAKVVKLLADNGMFAEHDFAEGEMGGSHTIRVFWKPKRIVDDKKVSTCIHEVLNTYWDWMPEFAVILHDPETGKIRYWHMHPGMSFDFEPDPVKEADGPVGAEMTSSVDLVNAWLGRKGV